MEYILYIVLIVVFICIVKENNNLKLVLFTSVFSLVCASLYYMNKAPDVALAEAAIGSAITPLIYIVAISKQREFIVINKVKDDFLHSDVKGTKGRGNVILEEFCKYYNLNLKIFDKVEGKILGVFREKNVDLIVEKTLKTNKYLFVGKESSILMNKLEQLTKNEDDIKVLKIGEFEKND